MIARLKAIFRGLFGVKSPTLSIQERLWRSVLDTQKDTYSQGPKRPDL